MSQVRTDCLRCFCVTNRVKSSFIEATLTLNVQNELSLRPELIFLVTNAVDRHIFYMNLKEKSWWLI